MELVEFGSIMNMTKGKKPIHQSKEEHDGFLPYVDIKAFEKNIIENYTDGERCLPCEDGDILIVCDGSRSGLVGKAIKGYVGSTLAKITANGVISNYLFYFLQGKFVLLNTKPKGTGTPHLNPELLKEQKIYIPPPQEQESIVSRIEELFSELDKGVETLQTIKRRLAVYRQAVLKEAFGNIACYVPFGKIMDSRLGKMLDNKKNTGTLHKYLRNINVRWFSFDLSDLLEIRIEDEKINRYAISEGDLVICEGGEPGRCAVWTQKESICYQKALHRIRFRDGSNPYFYMYYLWFAARTGRLREFYTGTGIKHLTGQALVKVQVPTLERGEQDIIVEKIESRLSVCDSIEKAVERGLAQAEALRQSILKKAFEGGFC